MEYFIEFLEKCIRHFSIIQDNYDEFQNEFEKIKRFVNQSDSQILRQKFGFLLNTEKFLKNGKTKKNLGPNINHEHVKKQLKSLKYLTLIAIHLSKNN